MPVSWLTTIFWFSRPMFGGVMATSLTTAAAGLYYLNPGVAVGFIAAVVVWLLWIVGNAFFREMVFGDTDRWFSSINQAPGGLPFAVLAYLGPSFLIFILSAFVFWETNTTAWFTQGRSTASQSFMLAIPFAEDIRSIRANYNITQEVQAVTRDGKKVKGSLSARVRPVLTGSELQEIVLTERNPNQVLNEDLVLELRRKFQSSIGQLNLAELHYNLEWDWQEGDQKPLRTPLGVEWRGRMSATNFTVYFTESE